MTCNRVFEVLSALSGIAWIAAIVIWRQTGLRPEPWIIWVATSSLGGAVLVGLVCDQTRPRLMLRFLAGLFALVGVVALAADAARGTNPANFSATSLTQHLSNLTPSLLNSIKGSVSRVLGPETWDAYLGLLFNAPAFLVFGILALICGVAGRPRRVVEIFVN